MSSFLRIDKTFGFFQLLGKDPLCKQFLKIIDKGFTIDKSHIFSNLIDRSSYPCALLIFNECIILRISWSLNEIDDKLALVIAVVTKGKVLWFETGVHWNAKKTLKWFAFSLKVNLKTFNLSWVSLHHYSMHSKALVLGGR